MNWFKAQHSDGLRLRMMAALGMTSGFLLMFLIISVAVTGRSNIYAQKQDNAILAIKIDDVKVAEEDTRKAMADLLNTVQDLRDKQNQMQGMLIGFGGLAALLQIVNTVLQLRGDKNAKG